MNASKSLLSTCLISLLAGIATAGNTWWVDPVNGDDTYDGTAEKWQGGESKVGPRRSLREVMALAKAEDVVYALPGEYREKASATGSARVAVPDGVKLISTAGREKTFIFGQEATVNSTGLGLGDGALRCAYLVGTGSIFGFTLTGGRTTVSATGGGVLAAGAGFAVDCVISNCYAKRGGAYQGKSGGLVNCLILGNGSSNPGASVYEGRMWNTVLADSVCGGSPFYDSIAYNSTILDKVTASGLDLTMCYNCAVFACDYLTGFTNCYLAAYTSRTLDDSNKQSLKADTELAIDERYVPVEGKNLGIGKADWFLYTNKFPAVAADYMMKDVWGNSRVQDGTLDVGAVEYVRNTTWWVDPVNGDDTYDGTAEKWRGGESKIGPRKSLQKAIALARSGEVVYALPGEYREEYSATGSARVLIPDGVKLISTDGREKTFIFGREATVNPSPLGLGDGALRCVYLEGTGSIFGFTLTGGRTTSSANGGGVLAAGAGFAVDCVISNCYAKRGGAYQGSGGGLVNCLIVGNGSSSPGASVYMGRIWNSVLAGSVCGGSPFYDSIAYNSTILDKTTASSLDSTMCYNCAVFACDYLTGFTNCYLAAYTSRTLDDGSKKSLNPDTELATDERYVPVGGKNFGIDKADWFLFTNSFPVVAKDYMMKDVWGNHRLVNGCLDVGAAEYAYCNEYSRSIGKKGVKVLGAWSNVTAGDRALVLGSGDVVDLKWEITTSGPCSFAVTHSPSDEVKVVIDGNAVEPKGGLYGFDGTLGSHTISVSLLGSGMAILGNFKGNSPGCILVVR